MSRMMLRPLVTALLLACGGLISCGIADDDIEQSRIYGKTFVAPIRDGQSPPVCVTEAVAGPEIDARPKAMRDPKRPSIFIFCKQLDAETCERLVALDETAVGLDIPMIVIITDIKGIAGDVGNFPEEHYFTPEQSQERLADYARVHAESKLKRSTVAVAVNRFWREDAGYGEGDDLIVAYVRQRIQLHESLNMQGGDVDARLLQMSDRIKSTHISSASP